jgi:hypothetical protein
LIYKNIVNKKLTFKRGKLKKVKEINKKQGGSDGNKGNKWLYEGKLDMPGC